MNQDRLDSNARTSHEAIENDCPEPFPAANGPAIHYMDLPAAEAGAPLAQEWDIYRREVGRLLAEGHQGRHVVIKGTQIIGIFDTWQEAREAGLKLFRLEPFFVHPIRDREPFLRIRGVNLPCPS